jgi:hypothetical protein
LNLDELQAILEAKREQDHENRKFMAALKGINLDEGDSNPAQEAFERSQMRAAAILSGKSEEEVSRLADANTFGLEFETEE